MAGMSELVAAQPSPPLPPSSPHAAPEPAASHSTIRWHTRIFLSAVPRIGTARREDPVTKSVANADNTGIRGRTC